MKLQTETIIYLLILVLPIITILIFLNSLNTTRGGWSIVGEILIWGGIIFGVGTIITLIERRQEKKRLQDIIKDIEDSKNGKYN